MRTMSDRTPSSPTPAVPTSTDPVSTDAVGADPVGADPVKARRAGPGDAAEVARLRQLMVSALFGPEEEGPWTAETLARLARWFADPDARTAAFVVDAPDGQGLAASVIGTFADQLPGSRNPSGLVGYVYGVSTDPRWQRLGCSRVAMTALLEWFEQHDVARIDLHASEFGERLYRQLGFSDAYGKALAWRR
jgi:GNAT superfamily N-acetyltransferase